MTYTEGRWLLDKDGKHIYEDDATGRTIAVIVPNDWHPRTPEEELGNAQLIAAAPELLSALKDMMSMVGVTIGPEHYEECCARVSRACRIITKAEGRVLSYKVEVKTPGDTTWSSNSLRFATHEQATDYGLNLAYRWTAVTEWRVGPSEDPVNRPEEGK